LNVEKDERRHWRDAELFYTPAIIDYAYLEKYFIDAEMHRLEYAVEWPVYDDKGTVRDIICDTVLIPDALHALQVSIAFLEKTLKYLICIYGVSTAQRVKDKARGHNLAALVLLVNQATPEFIKGMSPEATACLEEIQKIDYTILRYLDQHTPEFEMRILDLKELLQYSLTFLKRTRWEKTHSDPAKRSCIGNFGNTIEISIEEYRQPLKSIFKASFERVLQHKDLSEEEKGLIVAHYRFDRDAERYLLLDGSDDTSRAALVRAFEKAKFVFLDFGRLKIKIRH